MCGINGFTFEDREKIDAMNDLIINRGPDGSGIYCNQVSLGHRRLKIIDLSDNAAQPMSDSEGKIWLIFNGEIYNFQEIRKELEKEGYKFKSKSDTEVIIYAYKKWGYECVNHFNGMWAFAIYDQQKNKIFLSKDRIGKKPLYYCQRGRDFIFSSEVKPLFVHNIPKVLNKKAVSSFLSYRGVLENETFFEGIFKMLPAHNLLFDIPTGKIERIWEYWDVPNKPMAQISEDEAKKQVESILRDAVKMRLISDVPIGSLNSGGLDSSVISAIMASVSDSPIRTFTVQFSEEGFDETSFSRLLAKHCNTIHKEIMVDNSNFFDLMKEYVKIKGQPIGIPNEIALYLLFKNIKKEATVVISGDGADELFAGYSRIFTSPHDYEKLKELEKNPESYKSSYPSLYKKYNGRFFKDELEHFMFLYNYFPEEEKNFILKDEYKQDFSPAFRKYFNRIDAEYAKKISYMFLKLHLFEPHVNRDNSSMASAVELRCPFYDYKLIEYVFNLPSNLKNPWKSEEDEKLSEYKNCDEIADEHTTSKYILKKVAEDYIPNEIIFRKKLGFPLPLQKWFKNDFFEESKKLLLSKDSKINIALDAENLKVWIEKGMNGDDRDFGQKLWRLVSLELWLREWF